MACVERLMKSIGVTAESTTDIYGWLKIESTTS
jgi:hypothetical protein